MNDIDWFRVVSLGFTLLGLVAFWILFAAGIWVVIRLVTA